MIKLKKLKPVPTNCPFCKNKTEPDYKEVEILKSYFSERGRIVGKARSGICAKHQRRIAREVKHARYLGLMSFIIRPQ